jgi:hypothetical protein
MKIFRSIINVGFNEIFSTLIKAALLKEAWAWSLHPSIQLGILITFAHNLPIRYICK